MQLSPAPSINDQRTKALMQIIHRLDTLDLTPLLVYRIPSVPPATLEFLAWQFDVLDPEWTLLQTGSGLASLLLQAIPLHQIRGTVGSIKAALAALGYPNPILLEGQNSWGGTSWPVGQGWAVFRVVVNLSAGQQIAPAQATAIQEAVTFFKPKRNWLDSIIFNEPPLFDSLSMSDSPSGGFLEALSMSDAISVTFPGITDTLLIPPTHNDQFQHAGFTYVDQQIGITDGGITVNGTPQEGNK